MGTLNVGRVGLDVTLDTPSTWGSSSGLRGRTDTVTGWLAASTLVQTQALRTELLEQAALNIPIAVTWSDDATMDGFFYLRSVNIDARARYLSISGTGRFPFSLTLERIGGVAQTQFQSLITGTVLANDFTVTEGESTPFHAIPVGGLTYDTTGTPTALERTSEDGAVPTFTSVAYGTDPTWSAIPGSYYSGAAEVWVTSRLRAGLDAPNDPDDFMLTNGLIRLTPGTTTGTSNGKLLVETYDGSQWDTAVQYGVYWSATTLIPKWHYVTVIRNTPEVCTLRLVRDAAEAPPTAFLHTLDISLRRGSRYLECLYSWSGSAVDVEIRRETNEAATAITPTGAGGSYGIRATSNDADGNRYVVACPNTQTQDLVNGRVKQSSTNTMAFMLGAEVGGTGAASGDTAAEIMLQYIGHISETVRAVRR